jgi:hypothetical protein
LRLWYEAVNQTAEFFLGHKETPGTVFAAVIASEQNGHCLFFTNVVKYGEQMSTGTG